MNNKNNYRIFNQISSISRKEWDLCNHNGNLFTSYNFLKLLEDSQSLMDRTGWYPCYFSWYNKDTIDACVPAYKKTNSQGEFVFDHSWANVFERLSLPYYPKLVIASPFTPITGERLLIKNNVDMKFKLKMIKDIINYCSDQKLSSLHVNFIEEEQISFYLKNNFIVRFGEQFHFINKSYSSFDDFLNNLSYKKRKAIIKERNSIKKIGINVEVLKADEVTKDVLNELYIFYLKTIDKKWSYDYFTKDFFLNLNNYLKENLIVIIAKYKSEIIAAALNFVSKNNLYGRYWGAKKELPFLHFELCYYKAIELAIAMKLNKVEAGAQGPHKIKRGYAPTLTYSAHYILNQELHKIFNKYNELEKENVLNQIKVLKEEYSPYKIIN